MRTLSPCPECQRNKWSTRSAPDDFRREVLHCMECGFEVDKHVALTARRIVRRDGGQDVRADAPAQVPNGPAN